MGGDNTKGIMGSRETYDVGPSGLGALWDCGEGGVSAGSSREGLVEDPASQNFHKPPVPTHPR